jgi:putative colanic acid biosynthesis acetyltransferase WcaF
MSVNLAEYRPNGLDRGKPVAIEALWMVVSVLLFRHSLALGNGFKRFLLRLFGAKIGDGVIIKPGVRIKFPWKLSVGDHAWIGEGVWIDNLDSVTIKSHACISQEAMLVCGNHDYSKRGFDLITGGITVEIGAWIASRAIVGPGVTVGTHAVLTAGSVATKSLDPYGIYRGNPAIRTGTREIRD